MANQNILVVGGSAGIGRALVEQLLAQGDHPYVWKQPRGWRKYLVSDTRQQMYAQMSFLWMHCQKFCTAWLIARQYQSKAVPQSQT
ncbi:MAG: hypothetical protein R2795_25945 [Saprospiraceae bacterium]